MLDDRGGARFGSQPTDVASYTPGTVFEGQPYCPGVEGGYEPSLYLRCALGIIDLKDPNVCWTIDDGCSLLFDVRGGTQPIDDMFNLRLSMWLQCEKGIQ